VPAHRARLAASLIAASILGFDQMTKAIIVAILGPAQQESRIELAADWLTLEYAENRGAVFGLFQGLAQILAVTSIAVTIALLVHFLRTHRPPLWHTVAIGAIAGGAIGNLVDRLRLGYVVDFVSVGSWPNFNLADSAVTIGVLLLAWGWTRPTNATSSMIPG